MREWNAELAALLSGGFPEWKIIAEVSDDMRFELEAEITRRYRQHHRVFNLKDGNSHTKASVARIREGIARGKAARAA